MATRLSESIRWEGFPEFSDAFIFRSALAFLVNRRSIFLRSLWYFVRLFCNLNFSIVLLLSPCASQAWIISLGYEVVDWFPSGLFLLLLLFRRRRFFLVLLREWPIFTDVNALYRRITIFDCYCFFSFFDWHLRLVCMAASCWDHLCSLQYDVDW